MQFTTNYNLYKPEDTDDADNADLNANFDTIDEALASEIWVGKVSMSLTSTVPNAKYLNLDGSNVSRTTYSDLFDEWGTTYGSGDGSTTFGLPDFRLRIPIGMAATFLALGDTDSHTSLAERLGSFEHQHSHANSTPTGSSGGHSHSITSESSHTHSISGETDVGTQINSVNNGGFGAARHVKFDGHDHDGVTGSAGGHSHGGSTGSESSHTHTVPTTDSDLGINGYNLEDRHAFITVNYFVRALL